MHLHLSDNEGFRIESTAHPEIVSADHLAAHPGLPLYDTAHTARLGSHPGTCGAANRCPAEV